MLDFDIVFFLDAVGKLAVNLNYLKIIISK